MLKSEHIGETGFIKNPKIQKLKFPSIDVTSQTLLFAPSTSRLIKNSVLFDIKKFENNEYHYKKQNLYQKGFIQFIVNH